MDNKLLEMSRISKAFSGVKALSEVNFDLFPGQVHALVGENGAGKSTLVKILTGIENKDAGNIKINGKDTHIKNPHHARTLGVAAIFQELSQIPSLTVAENILLGQEPKKANLFLDRNKMVGRTRRVLQQYDIDLEPKAKLSVLSTAQRQLAEIAKAVSLEPKILIMDEPTSALTDSEAEIVFKIIEGFKKQGAGIIYVSHRMDEIFRIADTVTILRDGRLIESCDIKELDLSKIVELMVGREVELYQSSKDHQKKTKPKLEVKGLTRKGLFSDISFTLYEGEVLGIAGLVGSGRSELAKAIFGVDKIDSGKILLDGSPVRISSVKDALKLGIALLPESRHLEGLVLNHSLEQNVMLTILKRFSWMGMVNRTRANRVVKQKIQELNVKPLDLKKIIKFFSGGNQQKAVIAKWLLTNPQILIVDEPTTGVDVHTKSEVHRLIRSLVHTGVSVIMISSEMPELLAHSDRILVMNKGRILGTFCDTTAEKIMSLIMHDMMNKKNAVMN